MDRPDRMKDRGCLVAIIFFILGLGTLLPWNFFMTASLYFNDRLKGEESRNDSDPGNGTAVNRTEYYFNNWMTLLSQLPLLLFTFLNSFLYQLISERLRIAGSLLFILFFFILTAVLVKVPMEPGVFFSVTMATIWFINSFGAVVQGSLFGLVGLLPQKYSTLFMSGQGLAGTFAALAMLLALSNPGHGLLHHLRVHSHAVCVPRSNCGREDRVHRRLGALLHPSLLFPGLQCDGLGWENRHLFCEMAPEGKPSVPGAGVLSRGVHSPAHAVQCAGAVLSACAVFPRQHLRSPHAAVLPQQWLLRLPLHVLRPTVGQAAGCRDGWGSHDVLPGSGAVAGGRSVLPSASAGVNETPEIRRGGVGGCQREGASGREIKRVRERGRMVLQA